ncbi:ThiF family adenylyltransferase [Streptomyces sp. NPDC046332]|uniref:ThiF family adenylyltransferase n=1 Tax=Streptomyces sp. NPDC046332 TaxID=3155133 RepID=UPI0034045873
MTQLMESGQELDHVVLPSVREMSESFRPLVLDPATSADSAVLAGLRESSGVREVHDRIEDQVEELLRCRAPHDPFGSRSRSHAIAEAMSGQPGAYGRWVWYPWSGRLVHVLPEAEFRLVRTDRNRDKITREQQLSLLRRRVGVIGLSVGSSAAMACAMEGVGGAFRLADFDRLGLSNLNRLRAGVHELGVEKSVLCARRMYELDPYLDIEVFRGGITEDTIEEFFGDRARGEGLDLLVEECDTPWVKVAAREHARRRRVPVLMDTNDRGLLDIERFDLEPDRPLFHGCAGDVRADNVRNLDREEAIRFLLTIVDERRLSPAMTDAITRVGRSLSSWPQLASGVMLGAALITDTARRILLGEALQSGRHSIDLHTLVAVGTAQQAPWGADQ